MTSGDESRCFFPLSPPRAQERGIRMKERLAFRGGRFVRSPAPGLPRQEMPGGRPGNRKHWKEEQAEGRTARVWGSGPGRNIILDQQEI